MKSTCKSLCGLFYEEISIQQSEQHLSYALFWWVPSQNWINDSTGRQIYMQHLIEVSQTSETGFNTLHFKVQLFIIIKDFFKFQIKLNSSKAANSNAVVGKESLYLNYSKNN